MTKQDFNEGLLGFLDASPTPFHATQNMAGMFANAGFIKLHEEQKWKLEKGKKYYVTRNDSSIIAFTCTQDKNYVMVGVHTDSPNLKLKPNPIIKEHGVVKFGVEPYGGVLLNPWFDRDLSLAGRVTYLDSNNMIKDALIDAKKPIAIIPSLAIHLERDANSSKSINAQTDISPILSTSDEFNFDEFLKEQLKISGIPDVKELYANELSLYDTQNASFVGLNNDFIASARLDNLLCCYVGMLSICSIDDKPMLFIASDHEEVGSESTSGAGGSFLENTLRRLYPDYEEYMQMIRSSLMISADNAHAIHPNFPSKHDSKHAPHINKGSVIKVNSNQRYASNSKTISRFMNVASSLSEPIQSFVTRSDMGCGSTIGPITASRLGIDTIDVGLPTFAMHSIRELCGSDDAHSLYKIILGFSS
ncbi:MAG: M18 family aminopeptidase [Sulfurimonas sp. RIFOXYD12_FULL_33_39]|uniref:M18 family aminopeptidase n=1 Tax=unclassified Sulfurimonas TaxID=2623549 RepID=UPI0008D459BD|nr:MULTISPECIES: M18 family aminopeptidase [unclassified Sulfurimonas]OHE06519.1 MAG: M18 family aminopeptidase [Sulfurimonas sp. RIFCSPLOWO2_12_FULL_34_6]OHE09995.1 MAG: M18 family aminopeptidase [Sulfurimonas sp. RIFOXYD12_FULL_33_39]OHE14785.1 MAG: M18 family aminopeptidase [Sulfurimonas sp. RIFOXYD2_FULL_34_21]DAB28832.1 MAG TPA: M18 family aminopeptidase [Sulfurimonas sp. UBA10385]